MAGRVDVKINEDFFRELGYSREVEAILDAVADATVTTARGTAPNKTGAYRASIHKETTHARFRLVKKVVADDPKAAIIEAKQATLRKALRQAKKL